MRLTWRIHDLGKGLGWICVHGKRAQRKRQTVRLMDSGGAFQDIGHT